MGRLFMQLVILFQVLLICSSITFADTIIMGSTNSEKEEIIADRVLVQDAPKRQDGTIHLVTYYFYHARKRTIEEENKQVPKKESYLRVEYSTEPERKKLISSFKNDGGHAQITDVHGLVKDFFCLTLYRFFDRSAYINVSSFSKSESLVRLRTKGNYDLKQFSDIAVIEFPTLNNVKILMKDNKSSEGSWDTEGATVTKFKALDSAGQLIEIDFDDVVKIVFPITEAITQPDDQQPTSLNWGDTPEAVRAILGKPDKVGLDNALRYNYGNKDGFVGFLFDRSSNGLDRIIVAPDLTSVEGAAQGGMVDPKTLPNLPEAKGFLGDFLRSR